MPAQDTCECGCEHCPTVVWDIEDQPAYENAEFAGWVAANAIDPYAAALTPFRVVRQPDGRYEILWMEIVASPNEADRQDASKVRPRGIDHEWGEPEKVKVRRRTPMTVPPPGFVPGRSGLVRDYQSGQMA